LAQSYRRVVSSPRKRLKIFSVKIQLLKKTEAKKMATTDRNMKKEDKVLNVNKVFVDNLEEYLTCSKCKKVPRNAIVSWYSAQDLICKSCFDSSATYIYDNKMKANTGVFCTIKCQHCGPSVGDHVCGTTSFFTAIQVLQCGANRKAEFKPALSPFVAKVIKMLQTKCKFTHNGCQVVFKLMRSWKSMKLSVSTATFTVPSSTARTGHHSLVLVNILRPIMEI
jgi:hypothetical protein